MRNPRGDMLPGNRAEFFVPEPRIYPFVQVFSEPVARFGGKILLQFLMAFDAERAFEYRLWTLERFFDPVRVAEIHQVLFTDRADFERFVLFGRPEEFGDEEGLGRRGRCRGGIVTGMFGGIRIVHRGEEC